MKKLLTILLLLSFIFCFSQNRVEYDIHISLDEFKENIQIENDTMTYQYINLKNHKKNYKAFFINDKGELMINVTIKASNNRNNLTLIYSNINENNKPFLKKTSSIKNILNYPTDFVDEDLEKIFKILKEAKSIYIIEKNDIVGYDVLKKVMLKEYAKL
ncbi:hypothetical protein IMCC3317_20960 [Kordia antarctica]|uniref:CHRD domain-containing protein n=1 Tax=Kordia antarctica TaxID=1218801 RepID=A0A7L4ZKH9_9FLAO|nr:hypothetical protein [Kordia antarctica]QHI36726.1 hypothetical protein IMCC3317_20960 [Kordia antarctica]